MGYFVNYIESVNVLKVSNKSDGSGDDDDSEAEERIVVIMSFTQATVRRFLPLLKSGDIKCNWSLPISDSEENRIDDRKYPTKVIAKETRHKRQWKKGSLSELAFEKALKDSRKNLSKTDEEGSIPFKEDNSYLDLFERARICKKKSRGNENSTHFANYASALAYYPDEKKWKDVWMISSELGCVIVSNKPHPVTAEKHVIDKALVRLYKDPKHLFEAGRKAQLEYRFKNCLPNYYKHNTESLRDSGRTMEQNCRILVFYYEKGNDPEGDGPEPEITGWYEGIFTPQDEKRGNREEARDSKGRDLNRQYCVRLRKAVGKDNNIFGKTHNVFGKYIRVWKDQSVCPKLNTNLSKIPHINEMRDLQKGNVFGSYGCIWERHQKLACIWQALAYHDSGILQLEREEVGEMLSIADTLPRMTKAKEAKAQAAEVAERLRKLYAELQ